jgi:hypothetical protein
MKMQTNIIEYNLTASEFNWDIAPGKTIEAWGFNEQVPGPVLKANNGNKPNDGTNHNQAHHHHH